MWNKIKSLPIRFSRLAAAGYGMLKEFVRDSFKKVVSNWPAFLFVAAAILHVQKRIAVDVYALLLLVLAALPWLFRTVAGSFKRLTLTKDGISFEAIEAGAVDTTKPLNKPDPNESKLVEPNIKMILATFWHYQKAIYGTKSKTRWAMGPRKNSSNYLFRALLASLRVAGDLDMNEQGLYYLTDKGLDRCDAMKQELEAMGPAFNAFEPVDSNDS